MAFTGNTDGFHDYKVLLAGECWVVVSSHRFDLCVPAQVESNSTTVVEPSFQRFFSFSVSLYLVCLHICPCLLCMLSCVCCRNSERKSKRTSRHDEPRSKNHNKLIIIIIIMIIIRRRLYHHCYCYHYCYHHPYREHDHSRRWRVSPSTWSRLVVVVDVLVVVVVVVGESGKKGCIN